MSVELETLRKEVEEMRSKVNEIHSLLTQARGAQRAVGWLVAFGGSSVFLNVVTNWKAILAFLRGAT